jgi:hypothetical protein
MFIAAAAYYAGSFAMRTKDAQPSEDIQRAAPAGEPGRLPVAAKSSPAAAEPTRIESSFTGLPHLVIRSVTKNGPFAANICCESQNPGAILATKGGSEGEYRPASFVLDLGLELVAPEDAQSSRRALIAAVPAALVLALPRLALFGSPVRPAAPVDPASGESAFRSPSPSPLRLPARAVFPAPGLSVEAAVARQAA